MKKITSFVDKVKAVGIVILTSAMLLTFSLH